MENANHPTTANVMAYALSRRARTCGAKLEPMGILYEDERDDVVDKEIVAVMAHLSISLTVLVRIRQSHDEDKLTYKWMDQTAHLGLTRDADGLVQVRG